MKINFSKEAMDKLKCRLGFHKPDEDWCLKWSSKVYYCNCKLCGNFIVHGKRKTYKKKDFYGVF